MGMQWEPEKMVVPGQESLRMSIVVRIPTPLRKLTENQDVVAGDGTRFWSALTASSASTRLKERLCDETGELRRFVNVYGTARTSVSRTA
jgi:hypothetical protein